MQLYCSAETTETSHEPLVQCHPFVAPNCRTSLARTLNCTGLINKGFEHTYLKAYAKESLSKSRLEVWWLSGRCWLERASAELCASLTLMCSISTVWAHVVHGRTCCLTSPYRSSIAKGRYSAPSAPRRPSAKACARGPEPFDCAFGISSATCKRPPFDLQCRHLFPKTRRRSQIESQLHLPPTLRRLKLSAAEGGVQGTNVLAQRHGNKLRFRVSELTSPPTLKTPVS